MEQREQGARTAPALGSDGADPEGPVVADRARALRGRSPQAPGVGKPRNPIPVTDPWAQVTRPLGGLEKHRGYAAPRNPLKSLGAEGRTRTDTASRPLDFESLLMHFTRIHLTSQYPANTLFPANGSSHPITRFPDAW